MRILFFVFFLFQVTPFLKAEDGVLVFEGLPYPKNLSEWRIFLKRDGKLDLNKRVFPYDLVNPLFTDYALKFRTLWIPEGKKITYESNGDLSFPIGTVLTKTFSYAKDSLFDQKTVSEKVFSESLDFMNKRHQLETRLLVKTKDRWYSLPYVWNEDQKDAKLKVIGKSFDLKVEVSESDLYEFTYRVPNMNQCISCHMEVRGDEKIFRPIGPKKARNLNRPSPFDSDGKNQLEKMKFLGLIENFPDLRKVEKVISWESVSASFPERARAYLDANCAYCHSPKGSGNTSGLYLNLNNHDRVSSGVCKKPVASGNGSSGGNYDLSPGSPEDSILYLRMNSLDPSVMMPELGRSLIHKEAVELIGQWILGMDFSCDE